MTLLIACLIIAGLHMNPGLYVLAVVLWLGKQAISLLASLN